MNKDIKFLEDTHLALSLIEKANRLVLKRFVAAVRLRDAPLHAIPIVCTIPIVPVAALIPNTHVV